MKLIQNRQIIQRNPYRYLIESNPTNFPAKNVDDLMYATATRNPLKISSPLWDVGVNQASEGCTNHSTNFTAASQSIVHVRPRTRSMFFERWPGCGRLVESTRQPRHTRAPWRHRRCSYLPTGRLPSLSHLRFGPIMQVSLIRSCQVACYRGMQEHQWVKDIGTCFQYIPPLVPFFHFLSLLTLAFHLVRGVSFIFASPLFIDSFRCSIASMNVIRLNNKFLWKKHFCVSNQFY